MLRTPLLALDDSDGSQAAVELGIHWAEEYGATRTGIAVVNEAAIHKGELVPIGGAAIKDQLDREAVGQARSRARQALDGFCHRCHARGVKHRSTEVETESPENLVLEAQRHDVILMGKNSDFVYGVRNVQGTILEDVVRHAARPVVAVPDKVEGAGDTLAAYDGSLQAARAVQAFVATGLPAQKKITVLSVHADSMNEAAQCANRAREYLRHHAISAETQLVARGDEDIASVILREAHRLQAGLIVMGAYGHGSLREFLFGSETRTVVARSRIPVFLSH